jgi:hypothetical protein
MFVLILYNLLMLLLISGDRDYLYLLGPTEVKMQWIVFLKLISSNVSMHCTEWIMFIKLDVLKLTAHVLIILCVCVYIHEGCP